MQDEAHRAEQYRLKAELDELVFAEAECLRRAVAMVQDKAPGSAIRAVYAEVESKL